ncbi:MAG: DUF86 domain-containing protein [Comamonadaceae bacterium]|nr:MAG: DUF86 domain-containing protein [Comamonadaceae bacterium]
MKHALRLADYLQHMQQAASDAIGYVEHMDRAAFIQDRRTQQAVVFNLVVLGEAAGNVLSDHAAFAAKHVEVPWRAMRTTRSRVAHGYFDINVDVIWETVQAALPQLLAVLPPVVEAAAQEVAQGKPLQGPTAAS